MSTERLDTDDTGRTVSNPEAEILDALEVVANGEKTGEDATPHLQTAADLTVGLKDEYGADVAGLLEGIIDTLAADESVQPDVAYIAKRNFESYFSTEDTAVRTGDGDVYVEFTDDAPYEQRWDDVEIAESWVTLKGYGHHVSVPRERIEKISHSEYPAEYVE